MGCNEKKSKQLGMPVGTANARLRKSVLFKLVQLAGLDTCFRCKKQIENVDDLSIEHKEPWMGVSSELFWAWENIAFSHLSCNVAVARRQPKTGRHGTHGLYTEGCRCKPCTDAHVVYNNEWRYRKGLRKRTEGLVHGQVRTP